MRKKTTLELVEQSEKVSLYSISFAILILGNGGEKRTSKYEQDAKLYGYALDLQKFDILLRNDIEAGIVTVEEKELTNIDDKEYFL